MLGNLLELNGDCRNEGVMCRLPNAAVQHRQLSVAEAVHTSVPKREISLHLVEQRHL